MKKSNDKINRVIRVYTNTKGALCYETKRINQKERDIITAIWKN